MKLLSKYSKISPIAASQTVGEGGTFSKLIRGMTLLISVFTLITVATTSAQTFSETQEETARFQNVNSSDNELYIHNINGDVTVEGYDGEDVQIS